MNAILRRLAAPLTLLALAACTVAPPTGPMVLATPPQGKEFDRFRQEDAYCRQFAAGALGGLSPSQAAGNAGVGSAVAGTAIGAAAGALIGSAAGAAGTGAAIGAGTGLLAGSAIGAGNAQAAGATSQQAYDLQYSQCMAGYGNIVQAGVLPPAPGAVAGPVPYVTPYATPWAPPAGVWAPGLGEYGFGAPSVTLGFGVYRGWGGWGGGWGGYRPWYYGRPFYGRPYGWRRW